MSKDFEQHDVQDVGHQHTKRDAETQTVLGAFVTFLSIPVVIGTFFATTTHSRVVNLVAGLVLMAIGIGIIVWGRVTASKVK